MAVHYPPEVIKLARERGHVPACIALSKTNVLYFSANSEVQILLLQMIQSYKEEEAALLANLRAARDAEFVTPPLPGMEGQVPMSAVVPKDQPAAAHTNGKLRKKPGRKPKAKAGK